MPSVPLRACSRLFPQVLQQLQVLLGGRRLRRRPPPVPQGLLGLPRGDAEPSQDVPVRRHEEHRRWHLRRAMQEALIRSGLQAQTRCAA
uniref:Uncharacterized protein n=1 Tax=Aegilops tauschii subsp. strangulata TaxID=200361 RepID=A0A452Z622_AEGTS